MSDGKKNLREDGSSQSAESLVYLTIAEEDSNGNVLDHFSVTVTEQEANKLLRSCRKQDDSTHDTAQE